MGVTRRNYAIQLNVDGVVVVVQFVAVFLIDALVIVVSVSVAVVAGRRGGAAARLA